MINKHHVESENTTSQFLPSAMNIQLDATTASNDNTISPPISVQETLLADLDTKYAQAHPGKTIPAVEFHLLELLNFATAAMKCPCSNIELLGFGLYNKAYLLTFSDGKEAVGRVQYNKLTMQYRMQSEVGAMKFAAAKPSSK